MPEVATATAAKNACEVSGRPGLNFNIDGEGFGEEPGTVTIAGRTLETSRWIDRSIKGALPTDIVEGPVIVKCADGKTEFVGKLLKSKK